MASNPVAANVASFAAQGGVAAPPSKWLGIAQICVVVVLAVGLLAGAGGLAARFSTVSTETTLLEGQSFRARRQVTGYGQSGEQELKFAPVGIAVTPTVVSVDTKQQER